MKTKKKKLYKCGEGAKGCFTEGYKWTSNIQMQRCCQNPNCVLQRTVKIREKKEANKRSKLHQEKKEGRERLMDMPARLKRAREKAFQVWVKLRDFSWFVKIGKDPACVMCGNTNPQVWHACHFQSVGSKPELQFHPDNCHLGCGQCNFFAAQGDTQYRNNLIQKVGIETVEYLENFNAAIKWYPEEVEEIRSHFQELIKGLKQ